MDIGAGGWIGWLFWVGISSVGLYWIIRLGVRHGLSDYNEGR